MALTAAVDNHPTNTNGDLHLPMKGGVKIQIGAQVMVQSGFALEAAATTGVKVAGAAKMTNGGREYDNSAGADGDVTVVVETSDGPDGLRLYDYENSGGGGALAQTDLFADVYIGADAKTVTKTSTGSSVAGVMHGITSEGKIRIAFKRL
jgi:hypothetical protein